MYLQTCCSSRTTDRLLWPGRVGCKTSRCCSRGTSSFVHQRWWREGRSLSRQVEALRVNEGYQDYISASDRLDQSLCPSPGGRGRNTEVIYIHAFGRFFYPKQLAVHSSNAFDQFMHSLGVKPMTLELQVLCSSVWGTLSFVLQLK